MVKDRPLTSYFEVEDNNHDVTITKHNVKVKCSLKLGVIFKFRVPKRLYESEARDIGCQQNFNSGRSALITSSHKSTGKSKEVPATPSPVGTMDGPH